MRRCEACGFNVGVTYARIDDPSKGTWVHGTPELCMAAQTAVIHFVQENGLPITNALKEIAQKLEQLRVNLEQEK